MATNLIFPAPLDTDAIATGFAATYDDNSTDEENPRDSDAFTDATKSDNDEDLFAEQEAHLDGRIKVTMEAMDSDLEEAICLVMDIDKCNENVKHRMLVVGAIRHRFPLPILRL